MLLHYINITHHLQGKLIIKTNLIIYKYVCFGILLYNYREKNISIIDYSKIKYSRYKF